MYTINLGKRQSSSQRFGCVLVRPLQLSVRSCTVTINGEIPLLNSHCFYGTKRGWPLREAEP